MEEGTIKTQNPKCGLYWCLIEFIDWRYNQSCWYFWSLLWTVAPLPSIWPPPPLPPSESKRTVTVYSDSVWLWGGVGWGGVLRCVVDHILQVFNTLFLTRSRTYKIVTPPQTKTPVKTTFRNWCLYSSFVHGSACLTTLKKDCRLCLECRPLPRFPALRRQDRLPPLDSGARWRALQQNSHSACNKMLTDVGLYRSLQRIRL